LYSCSASESQKFFQQAGAEPDIFIWGGHWRGQFCNKRSCQSSL